MMRWLRGSIVGLIGCAAAGTLAGCGKAETKVEASAKAPKPVKVTVASLLRQPVERTVEVVGTLRGWEDVTVGSKRMGRVARVRHDIGDRVKPGEPLVDLETVDADLAVRQAEKRLQVELAKLGLKDMPSANFEVSKVPSVIQAQVKLERVKLNLARERSLIQRGAGTAQDFQNAENDQKGAEAEVEIATLTAESNLANTLANRIALDVAKQARVDLEIRAPIPSSPPPGHVGTFEYAVAKRSVSEGQMLKEGEAVFELVIEDPLRLWTSVPERFSGDVALGQEVRIHVASYPDEVFVGKVARINPLVDSVSRTFHVETAVPNPKGKLRAGGFAKASILTRRNDQAATVPMEAVVRFAGVTKIFLIEGEKARSLDVTIGLEGPGWVEVIGKLPEKAEVVTTGQSALADGTAIEILQAETETTSPAVKGEAGPKGGE